MKKSIIYSIILIAVVALGYFVLNNIYGTKLYSVSFGDKVIVNNISTDKLNGTLKQLNPQYISWSVNVIDLTNSLQEACVESSLHSGSTAGFDVIWNIQTVYTTNLQKFNEMDNLTQLLKIWDKNKIKEKLQWALLTVDKKTMAYASISDLLNRTNLCGKFPDTIRCIQQLDILKTLINWEQIPENSLILDNPARLSVYQQQNHLNLELYKNLLIKLVNKECSKIKVDMSK